MSRQGNASSQRGGDKRLRSPSSMVVPDSSELKGTALLMRLGKGVLALSLGNIIQIISQVSIVPLSLVAWGGARYGEWTTLAGLATGLKFADLGLQAFTANKICANHALGHRGEVSRVLHSALMVQIPMICIILIVSCLFLMSIPVERTLNLHTVGGINLSFIILLLVMEFLLGIPMGTVASVYRATGLLHRGAMVGVYSQLANLIILSGLITCQKGFLSIALARVGVAILASIWILRDLRRLYPWLNLGTRRGSWREGLKMASSGMFFLLVPLSDYISNQLTLIIVQRNFGGNEVVRLTTHRTMTNLVVMLSQTLMVVVWPELTSLHARGQKSQLIRTYRSISKFNMCLVAVVAIGILPLALWVYPLWTVKQLTIDGWTFALLDSEIILWGIWGPSSIFLFAINRHKEAAVTLVATAVITWLASLLLVPTMGIRGVALGGILGDVFIASWVLIYLACREVNDSPLGYMKEISIFYMKGIVFPLCVGLVGWYLIGLGYINLCVIVPFSIVLSLFMMTTNLVPKERALLNHLWRKVFARVR